jgi:hypothetical protein
MMKYALPIAIGAVATVVGLFLYQKFVAGKVAA